MPKEFKPEETTYIKYICVPPEGRNLGVAELQANGYEEALRFKGLGWKVWVKTETWAPLKGESKGKEKA